ncbi:MAG: DNA modification methylase [Myxococcales bacterium]|nr:DNA modification methylase [Myxococcales bacterium]
MDVRSVPLAQLHRDPANVRLHDSRNLSAIADSLARFGQQKPIVVNPRGQILAGNGTYEAAQQLGWTEILVVESSLEALEATAFAIADNRTSDLSAFDEPALARLLFELRAEDALDGVGFDDSDLDELLAALDDGTGTDLDDAGAGEPPETPVTRPGDLWLLGEHRLLCGDSTSADDMARLMQGDVAALLATDPPYLVDYRGGNHPQSWSNTPDVKDKSWDDYVDPESGLAFFTDWLRAALPHCRPDVPVYQWHATRRQALVEQAWVANGLLVHQTLIWAKARPVLTRCHFMWAHEPCFYGWPQGHMPERRPEPSARTVWEIDQVGEQDGIHPTQKPTEIFKRPIGWHTRKGEVVLEPFSGSGTQLIAAEGLGRRCRAMEISPAFVDVAVHRWQETTGGAATLAETGQTFDEVVAERAGAEAAS